ncbi:MAG: hypothetical protein SAL07_09810 [Oscillatoria sp. PMC 1051.18]|nr:hypothetical protein [Oscillatoria sp. PMC 1050.18]MEC5030198.1 hypothetical protein [Oscillatoria sp. PMC 1051.18]
MKSSLDCVFLDTNIYIIDAAKPNSYEREILNWLGFEGKEKKSVKVVISEELIEQILRVAKRLQNKDWGSKLIGLIWHNLNIYYVLLNPEEFVRLEKLGKIPREDIGVYLTAKEGKAECFVSANHKLIRALATETGDFDCFTPEDFVAKYL